MKKNCRHKLLLLLVCIIVMASGYLLAQDTKEEAPVNLQLKYFLPNNQVPYIKVITNKKQGRKWLVVPGVPVKVYLGAVADSNLLGKVVTAVNGEARVAFPPAVKKSWDNMDAFSIVAVSVPAANDEPLSAELLVKKAMMVLDTLSEDGARSVVARLKEKRGTIWVPIPDVEMKLRIKRLLGNLTVGDKEFYTADTSGTAMAPFLKDSLPGDQLGNIILLSVVEDNEIYGNLSVEKTVPWGKPVLAQTGFWHRTLWSTGNRAPIWLLVIAGALIAGVWGTIIYLIRQLWKIRKLGRSGIS